MQIYKFLSDTANNKLPKSNIEKFHPDKNSLRMNVDVGEGSKICFTPKGRIFCEENFLKLMIGIENDLICGGWSLILFTVCRINLNFSFQF